MSNQKIFSPSSLYKDYFKDNELSVGDLKSVMNNSVFSNQENKEKSIALYCQFIGDTHDKNMELNDVEMNNLNLSALRYLGVIPNKESPSNITTNNSDIALYGKKILDNIINTRSIDKELIIDLLTVSEKIKTLPNRYDERTKDFLTDYLTDEKKDVLIAKLSHLNSSPKESNTSNIYDYLNKKISNSQRYKDFNIDSAIKNNGSNVDVLNDIKNNKDIEKKEKMSISEYNDSVFLNEKIELRDQVYWEGLFNKKLMDAEIGILSWSERRDLKNKDKEDGGLSKAFNYILPPVIKDTLSSAKDATFNSVDNLGSLFHKNYSFVDPVTGLPISAFKISPFTKTISVDEIPSNENSGRTYELMAIAAKMKGIKKPVVNVYDKDPNNRQSFVDNCLRELIKQGYDIADIDVPKDCDHLKDPYKRAAQGISEKSELSDEQMSVLNQGSEGLPNQTNQDGSDLTRKLADEARLQPDSNVNSKLTDEGDFNTGGASPHNNPPKESTSDPIENDFGNNPIENVSHTNNEEQYHHYNNDESLSIGSQLFDVFKNKDSSPDSFGVNIFSVHVNNMKNRFSLEQYGDTEKNVFEDFKHDFVGIWIDQLKDVADELSNGDLDIKSIVDSIPKIDNLSSASLQNVDKLLNKLNNLDLSNDKLLLLQKGSVDFNKDTNLLSFKSSEYKLNAPVSNRRPKLNL